MINLFTNLGDSKINTKIEEFIYTACQELDINESTYDLNIDFIMDLEAHGFTDGDTDEANIQIKADLQFDEMILTLAHELIHAKQFLKGDLVDQTYIGEDYSTVEYPEQPWELEAYDRESEIARLFKL